MEAQCPYTVLAHHHNNYNSLTIQLQDDDDTFSLQVLESRALYNLGNVYHARGKHASLHASGYSQQEVDDFVRSSLEQAARHYE